jgi:hypothetical protein
VSTFVGLVGWKSFGKILTPDRNNDVFNLAAGAICACLSRKVTDAFLDLDQGIIHPEVVLRLCDKRSGTLSLRGLAMSRARAEMWRERMGLGKGVWSKDGADILYIEARKYRRLLEALAGCTDRYIPVPGALSDSDQDDVLRGKGPLIGALHTDVRGPAVT